MQVNPTSNQILKTRLKNSENHRNLPSGVTKLPQPEEIEYTVYRIPAKTGSFHRNAIKLYRYILKTNIYIYIAWAILKGCLLLNHHLKREAPFTPNTRATATSTEASQSVDMEEAGFKVLTPRPQSPQTYLSWSRPFIYLLGARY